MKIIQAYRTHDTWKYLQEKESLENAIVFVFACRQLLEKLSIIEQIEDEFSQYGHIVYGSTSGEIIGKRVYNSSISVTIVGFEKGTFQINSANLKDHNSDGYSMGQKLFNSLPPDDLKHILVLSEGNLLNGSELVRGLEKDNVKQIPITGGLCGDGDLFTKTLLGYNQKPSIGEVIIIGLYNIDIEISFGSVCGWFEFGPVRLITKSETNVLFEIDNQPALKLYKDYLGDKLKDLPKAALLYPLKVTTKEKKQFVRTVLSIDEEKQTMTLAGDIPVGSRVQLMMSSNEDIISGSENAAKEALKELGRKPSIAFVVSCVGRKLVLDQRVEEEIEVIDQVFENQVPIFGFYSYGEIVPPKANQTAQLQNQNLTLTLISE